MPSSEAEPQEALHFKLCKTPAGLTGVYAADNRWASLQCAVGPPLHWDLKLVLQAVASMVGCFSNLAVYMQCAGNVFHQPPKCTMSCTLHCPLPLLSPGHKHWLAQGYA